MGGTGADVFYGGEGADTFYFDSHATEVDVVKDFHSGVDTVRVDDWALGLSSISTAFGYDGENGGGSSATYVFDTWRNELWFDENGMEADGHHLIGVIEGDDLVETDLDIAMPGPY